MEVITLLVAFAAVLKVTEGGFFSNCHIEGLSPTDFMLGYRIKNPIDDVFDGVVATFKTKNIIEMKVNEVKYLDATFENETITIFTTENFKNFEKEARQTRVYSLQIELDFVCSDDQGDGITIYQTVTDTNNHYPVLNEESYEYNFGMTIPKDFDLTKLLPINAYDEDFTNDNIYYTMEESEHLKLGYRGDRKYGTDVYSTTLKALQDIKAPFKQEFTLVATDEGDPQKSTSAKLTVRVISPDDDKSTNSNENNENETEGETENENENENATGTESESETGSGNSVSPVFSQAAYLADYFSDHHVELKEPIYLTDGAQPDTKFQQTGFNEYIEVHNLEDPTKQQVTVIKNLPQAILDEQVLLIELTAENPGASVGRTTLVIRIEDSDDKNQSSEENPSQSKEEENENESGEGEKPSECETVHIWGTSFSSSVLPLIFSTTAIVVLVFLNVIILSLCFKRQKRVETNVEPVHVIANA